MEGGRRLLRCHNSEMQARRKDNKTASLQEAHSNGEKQAHVTGLLGSN